MFQVPFGPPGIIQPAAYLEAVAWIADAFARAETSASQYLSKSGVASEIGLDHLLLKELIDLEIPRTFGNSITAKVISEYIGGTRQQNRKEVADILLHVEFRYVDIGETLAKLVFLQSKKLVPTPARWSSRSMQQLIAGSYLRPTRFRYSKNSKIDQISAEQHALVRLYGGFVYYMLHCPWDIEASITRPATEIPTFSLAGSGGCRIFRPESITEGQTARFSLIEAVSSRLPRFIENLLMCYEGFLFLQEENSEGYRMRPLQYSTIMQNDFPSRFEPQIPSRYIDLLGDMQIANIVKPAVSLGVCFELRTAREMRS